MMKIGVYLQEDTYKFKQGAGRGPGVDEYVSCVWLQVTEYLVVPLWNVCIIYFI